MLRLDRLRYVLFVILLARGTAAAHEGPPFAVDEHAAAGPYTLSIWADPDLGEGKLYVVVSPAAPAGVTATSLTAWYGPQDKSAPARSLAGRLDPVGGVQGDRFVFEIPFAAPGNWDFELKVRGARGEGSHAFVLAIPPEGPQKWEIGFFVIPFAALILVFGVGYLFRRRRAPPS